MAREVGNGDIENVYRLQIINNTEQAHSYTTSVHGLPDLTLVTNAALTVPATGIGSLTVRLSLPAGAAQGLRGQAHPIRFEVQTQMTDQPQVIAEKSTFLVLR